MELSRQERIQKVIDSGVDHRGRTLHLMSHEQLLATLADERVFNEHFAEKMKEETAHALQLGQSLQETLKYMSIGSVVVMAPPDAKAAYLRGLEDAARIVLRRSEAYSQAANAIALTTDRGDKDMLGFNRSAVASQHDARFILEAAGVSSVSKRFNEIVREVREDMERRSATRGQRIEVLAVDNGDE